jgi:hypothetical protein
MPHPTRRFLVGASGNDVRAGVFGLPLRNNLHRGAVSGVQLIVADFGIFGAVASVVVSVVVI